jgi:hypothetical protein
MLTRKELFSIAVVSLVLGLVISLVGSISLLLTTTFFVFIVIIVNTLAKKVFGFFLDIDIEVKIWEIKQFWVKKHMHFKNSVQAGIFIPLIVKFVTVGLVNWMTCLTFDASGKVYRAARRHGIYSFSEVSEEEIGWIAAAGIIATLIFAAIFYIIGQGTLTRISIIYAFFNMIPAFDWDGAKIFFGSMTLWSFLAIITLIALAATFVIV